MLSPTAKVRRNGEVQIVPADELVPGDVVLIKSGDKVPADLRLISATNLQVQEAMLTGESVPVSKDVAKPVKEAAPLGDRRNMAYSATNVVSGQAEGIVVGTGDSAEIGQISRMVNTVETVQNNLSRQLDVFGRWLSLFVLLIVIAAFLLARFRAHQDWKDAFESAVSIAVAVIPEGLPAMVTVVLAIGVTVMARNNAIVRQLPAVETLGSVNVICSDKTGTLTKNEMTAVRIRTAATLFHKPLKADKPRASVRSSSCPPRLRYTRTGPNSTANTNSANPSPSRSVHTAPLTMPVFDSTLAAATSSTQVPPSLR